MSEFFNSPFFGALVAIVAVWITWLIAKRQIQASRNAADKNASDARDLAEKNDTRQRWWDAVMWFHDNRRIIGEQAFRAGIEALSEDRLVRTEAQRLILRAVTNAPKQ